MQKSLDFLGDGPVVRQKGKFYYQNPRSVLETCFFCVNRQKMRENLNFST